MNDNIPKKVNVNFNNMRDFFESGLFTIFSLPICIAIVLILAVILDRVI